MRIGLYPGTFDPVTNGHLDVIGRAIKLVDRLVIGVAINQGKGPMFTLEERVELIRSARCLSISRARSALRSLSEACAPWPTLSTNSR